MSSRNNLELKKQFSHFCDHCTYKVVMVGDYGVGKTTLFRRIKGEKTAAYQAGSVRQYSDSVDYCTKMFEVDPGRTAQVNFWDTGGAERFRSITRNYYTAASGVLLIYDATDPASLTHLRSWIDDAERYTTNAAFYLLGNKFDSRGGSYQVDDLSDAFAAHRGIKLHFKMSAHQTDDVTLNEILLQMAKDLHMRAEKGFSSTNRNEQVMTCTLARDTVSLLPPAVATTTEEKSSCCSRK